MWISYPYLPKLPKSKTTSKHQRRFPVMFRTFSKVSESTVRDAKFLVHLAKITHILALLPRRGIVRLGTEQVVQNYELCRKKLPCMHGTRGLNWQACAVVDYSSICERPVLKIRLGSYKRLWEGLSIIPYWVWKSLHTVGFYPHVTTVFIVEIKILSMLKQK